MGSIENLKEAFAGESQANRKYIAFARKAEAEGKPQVARLFRAAAEAETVHALAHFKVLKGVKSTAENLREAIEGEGFEYKEMYPKFLEKAQKEGNSDAVESFGNALEVEQVHHGLYSKALKEVQAGKDLPAAKIFVCGVCGNTVLDKAPAECPICGSPRSKFMEIA